MFIVFLTFNAKASLIITDNYSTDTSSGLDWLRLTETTGETVEEINAKLLPNGELSDWRYATSNEFSTLVSNIGGTPNCSNGIDYCGWSALNNGLTKNFVRYLGDTMEFRNYGYETEDYVGAAYGFIADKYTSNSQWVSIVYDLPLFTEQPTQDLINTFRHPASLTYPTTYTGHFLVRNTISVTEPGTLLLVFIGFCCFLVKRFMGVLFTQAT